MALPGDQSAGTWELPPESPSAQDGATPQSAAFLDLLPPLRLTDGQLLRPRDFAGQKLVLFFCPAGGAATRREIADYQIHMTDFENAGAWVVGIVSSADLAAAASRPAGIHLAVDPDNHMLAQTARAAGLAIPPNDGAVFVIDRCGTLRAAWSGSGHAGQALLGVEERP